MSLATSLMAVGLPGELATRVGYADRVPLDGSGTGQVGATPVLRDNTNIAMGTSPGDTAFVLPADAEYFQPYFLLNTTAEAALVYPPVGDTIDAELLNAAVQVPEDTARQFQRVEDGRWVSVSTGNSSGGGGTTVIPVVPGGDGVTDDTETIRASIEQVGENGALLFAPGRTYLISGQLQMLPGQTFFGYGATIKRRGQLTTTTTATITNPQTVVQVADASAFRVGMNITFADAATPQANLVVGVTLSGVNSEITQINGNTLTLATSPNASFSSGALVYLSFYDFVMAEGCSILGMAFDGNKANWPWGRWEVVNEIKAAAGADRALIENCHLYDAPAEGIQTLGAFTRIVNNNIERTNGNGVHFSGALNPVVSGNSITNCNLDTNVGHADGCVTWSNSIDDATVVNNYLANGIAGIGSIDSAGNSNVTVSGNIIRNCTSYGVRIAGGAKNLTITDNRIYDCGAGLNGGLFVQNNTGSGIVIEGNTFENSSVQILGAVDIKFSDNYLNLSTLSLNTITNGQITDNFVYAAGITFNILTACAVDGNQVDLTGNTTTACIFSASGTGSTSSALSRNTLIGGSYGVRISSNANDGLTISGNRCVANFVGAINIDSTGTQTGATIRENHVSPTTASASSWAGIRVQSNAMTVQDNFVFSPSAGRANYGIQIDKESMVLSNTVRGAYNLASIIIGAGSTSSRIQDNYVCVAVTDNGTTTTLVNNTIVGP